MTELRVIGDDLEMDGQRVAILEPNVRFGCSLRGRLEEALARANHEVRNVKQEVLLDAKPEKLEVRVQNAISQSGSGN